MIRILLAVGGSLAAWTLSSVAALAQTPVAAVDCGGLGQTAGGTVFAPDQPYTPGGWGHEGGTPVLTAETRLGPVDHPYEEVVRRARAGVDAYRFDLPNGEYLVRLHLCEILAHGRGLRRFDVRLEGQPALLSVDVAGRYGHDYAGVFTAPIEVTDGRLDVEFTPVLGQSLVGGIEVLRIDAPLPAPASAQNLVVDWSYGANVVHWDLDDSPGLLGWRVEASADASGPFVPIALQWSQPTRIFDLGAPVGVERFYRVVPIAASTAGVFVEGPPTAAVGATARSSSSSQLPVYELTIDPVQQSQLDALFESDPQFEVPAMLTVNGEGYAVSLRYSGFTSNDDPKKSYKLRFNVGETFQDRRELNLKSHFSDDSVVRQELSRRMYLAAGHEAPRATWVHLLVNGEFAGVYADLEVIEQDFLRHRELPDGPIYQAYLNYSASMFPIDPATNVTYENAYKKKTESDQPYDDLVQFIEELDATPPADLRAFLASKLDVDDFLDFWAATCVVADLEKVLRDYHLYLNSDTGRWSIHAWDTDASWKQNGLPYDFGSFPFWVGEHALAVAVLGDPLWQYAYRRKVEALLDGAASPEVDGPFETLYDEQFALIGDDVLADYRKYGWEDDGPFLDAFDLLLNQVEVRHDAIEGQFANDPAPKAPHDLWINELMASNASTATDPAGEYDDWVELVNAGDAAIDLAGHHLTDDPAVPTKWTFPAGTSIPAGGHLVVWCDGDLAQSGLHASFSLSAGGEAVALFAPGGTDLLDVIHFGPQRTDIAFGRSGGAAPGPVWALNADPTPGAANAAPDNLPPHLRLVVHTPSAPQPDAGVRFTAHADDTNLLAVEVRLRVNGGAEQAFAMTDLGGGFFEYEAAPFGPGATVEYWVRAIDADGDESRFPHLAPNAVVTFQTLAPPAQIGLVVNEVCADNDTLITDPQGQFEDFVELYNAGSTAVDLADHYLTDDLSEPDKWALPPGFVLQPGARVLVWCDNDDADGPFHASFSLSKDGEEIAVFRDEGTTFTLVDGFVFGPMPSDTAVGGVVDGTKKRLRLFDPTPGAPNAPAPGSFARYDSALGAGAPLQLALGGSLDLGGVFQLSAAGAPSVPCLLGIGFGAAALLLPGGQPLLIDTTSALFFNGTSNAGGVVTFPVAVPPVPFLTGLVGYAQVAVGTDVSEGVQFTIGN